MSKVYYFSEDERISSSRGLRGRRDLRGNIVTDPRKEHVIWKGDFDIKKYHAVYSDRLFSWDYKKYDKCCQAVFGNAGQYFYLNERPPEKIEEFLSLYFEKPVKLTAVLQAENFSTGFPYWCFCYEESPQKENTTTQYENEEERERC